MIDFATVLMGPLTTQTLGDYGADVIKVEPPTGDVARHAGMSRHPGMGSLYISAGRNKRSLVLDIKQQAGKDALLDLCRTADVFVHNVRPDAMRRAGLDAAAVRAVNPRLIYVALVGFGEDGCYANRPAFDDIIQGAAGVAGLFLAAGHDEPMFIPWNIADRLTGITAAHAVLAALLLRSRTGEGQSIEVPMFETVVQMVLGDHLGGQQFEPPIGPPGYARLLTPGRKPYRTRDGFIVATPYNDKQFAALFDLLEMPEETRRLPMFRTLADRQKHWPAIYALLAESFKGRSTQEWVRLCADAAIPCTAVRSLADLVADPHLAQVGLFQQSDHPSEGRIREVRPTTRWSAADVSIRRHAPRLGEHSEEVLTELGYTPERIASMAASGATVLAAPVGPGVGRPTINSLEPS